MDNSNMRLIAQIDRGPMVDDSNLNSVFYEHLTLSLQQSLAGDIAFGRWATTVHQGDCFILASNSLNCLVHLIEVGNGFVTFQVRGLEFRGTYCHQREVEAISEDLSDIISCWYSIFNIRNVLSFGNIWTLWWTAWTLCCSNYIIDGYSISDNSAICLFQVHELRRLLVTLFVKCMIYYSIKSRKFNNWISNDSVLKAMESIKGISHYVDKDPAFSSVNDEDFDLKLMGVSKKNFIKFYGDWIRHCLKKIYPGKISAERLELVNSFSFLISLLGRRALGTASFNRHANAAESFLSGLHALFNGDVRITAHADEWVFTDPEILSLVISPSVRMALKLHQDHFIILDDFDDCPLLYERINSYQSGIYISHEHDPGWRDAIIKNTPSLLALRHVFQDGQDDYKIIQLNRMNVNMRVIKLNKESVRAFWAGQQQELIFLRNRNTERGSIQNARQVLRNMINSSADQPIGYPIFVSPLITSYIETHSQIQKVIGPPLTLAYCQSLITSFISCLVSKLGTLSSSASRPPDEIALHSLAPKTGSIAPQISMSQGESCATKSHISSDKEIEKIYNLKLVKYPSDPYIAPNPNENLSKLFSKRRTSFV